MTVLRSSDESIVKITKKNLGSEGKISLAWGGGLASYTPSPFVHLPLRSRTQSPNPQGKERTG